MTPEEQEVMLADEMENFLRAGGTFTYSEWVELDDDQKAALMIAGDKLKLEQAMAIAGALRNPVGALRESAALDGGNAWVKYQLSQSINRYLAQKAPA